MNSNGGLVIASVATTLLVLAVVYFAWQTHNVLQSLDRLTVSQEATSREMKGLSGRGVTRSQNGRQAVKLPNVQRWLKSIEKPLAAKVTELMSKSRKLNEESFQRWSAEIQQQGTKQLQNFHNVMVKDREEAQRQYLQDEKRWQELISALGAERVHAKKQYDSQEKQWAELMALLQKHGESASRQYREVVERLRKEKSEAMMRTKQLEDDRRREIGKLLDQANQISQERKRQLSEFCDKRPESVICRDL